MRIGIYGGTFNPIHLGHINLIKGFYEKLNLDKIIVIPTATPPHKLSKDLASSEHRFAMCEIAVENLNYCLVSDIEIKRSGKSYTVDTLNELKTTYKNDEFFLLMGEDMFLIIDKWKSCEEIFSLAQICCAPRSLQAKDRLSIFAKSVQSKHDNFKYQLLDIEYIEASSTQVREGNFDIVQTEVLNYIKDNKLY